MTSGAKACILQQLKYLEKQTFAKHEAFDFNTELQKPNVELTSIIDDGEIDGDLLTLVAYLIAVHCKVGRTVRLHK